MKSNEWHIAIMQIYKNLFVRDAQARDELGELVFNSDGILIEETKKKKTTLTMSKALRPLLEFIDEYRRRVAAPANTLIRKKYSKYADLSYIHDRL